MKGLAGKEKAVFLKTKKLSMWPAAQVTALSLNVCYGTIFFLESPFTTGEGKYLLTNI